MTPTTSSTAGAGPTPVSAVTYLVLAKAPVPGAVKTRLTPAYSAHEAAALAAAALLDTLDVIEGLVDPGPTGAPASARVVVALTGDLEDAAAPAALGRALAGCRVVPQQGDGLGSRIAHAHRDAAGEFGATVQVGMDTPQVTAAVLTEASALVLADDGPDAALGLAEDGGWWLLALRRAGDARLVVPVPTSTPDTGQLTLAALRHGGLRVTLLRTLRDVDEPGDVARVAAEAPATRFAALAGTLGPREATA